MDELKCDITLNIKFDFNFMKDGELFIFNDVFDFKFLPVI